MRIVCVMVAALAAGCGRTAEISALAPAASLQCALEAAEQMGYERITGRAARGAIRVAQRLEEQPATVADPQDLIGPNEVRPVLRNPAMENQILFRHSGGMLRAQVVGTNEEGREIRGGADAEDHARMIVVQCTGPAGGAQPRGEV